MKRLLRLPSFLRLTLVFLIVLIFQNCTEQKIKEGTDKTPNITEYLRENPDYSMFLEILDITNYASYMNTYGTFTLFLPTNDAVKQYLKDLGVSSLKEVPIEDLKKIAKLHILDKTIATTSFTDGKIAPPTFYGQYLITGAANINGVSSTTVNKTSNIVISNILAGNGVIHVIDKVLRVADKTLVKTIEADKNLSLFTEVLKVTGWYDKLNLPLTYDANNVGSFLTVLAQSNDVFSKAGFNSLDDLKNRYSHLKDPTNPADSLNLFVQYHILPNLNYLSDMATTPTFITKAPLEVISSQLDKTSILLNHDIFNGVQEQGVAIVRDPSNTTCSNGVLHYVDGHFTIKKRAPSPVYFDLCDQPEFAANVANYRKSAGANIFLGNGAFKDITWVGQGTLSWNNNAGSVNGDLLNIFRFRIQTSNNSNGNNDIEFRTPVIVKGRYKVWVSYRTASSKASTTTKTYFDGVQTSRIVNGLEYANDPSSTTTGIPDRVYESQGYKRYIFPFVKSDNMISRLVGIVEVTTTGRHLIKFTTESCTGCGGGDTDRFDIVEFRPVDMDQIWPKFIKGIKTGVPSGNDLNGDGLIQRSEATKGDNGNSGY
ncbi:fasciclin domain-containing protein [Flavobacterium sp. HJJ]|uniref:fasciclin domain-containing protein n=1 Tax=Flavobacterium sp. HJJ TaxID=2783792 RepID=UPI00188B09A2|nr:fasciclin domain-containing protein [Flavobacterium sp. HJJ]MBF4470717.1 fasciclin domain-containing protein [Flavobacterium sp. HJJ]